uniref:Uncharacterized protein n=1 Tax=Panagrolaimus sp. PS1159 TaxID=55785 RepID=A0AC35FM97_9BILA
MSETPLNTLTASQEEEFECKDVSGGRILGAAEFYYNTSKTKISINRFFQKLDTAMLLLKLGNSADELKEELNKLLEAIDRMAENMDLSELSETTIDAEIL